MTEAPHGARFEGGLANSKALPGGAVQFDQTGLYTLLIPIMVQWRKKELVTVWPEVSRKLPRYGTRSEYRVWKSRRRMLAH